jgi:hypothetical protein
MTARCSVAADQVLTDLTHNEWDAVRCRLAAMAREEALMLLGA